MDRYYLKVVCFRALVKLGVFSNHVCPDLWYKICNVWQKAWDMDLPPEAQQIQRVWGWHERFKHVCCCKKNKTAENIPKAQQAVVSQSRDYLNNGMVWWLITVIMRTPSELIWNLYLNSFKNQRRNFTDFVTLHLWWLCHDQNHEPESIIGIGQWSRAIELLPPVHSSSQSCARKSMMIPPPFVLND